MSFIPGKNLVKVASSALTLPFLVPALSGAEPDAKPNAHGHTHGDILSHQVGDTTLRLIDISAITQFAVGIIDGEDGEEEWAQTGAHDPKRDGFDFQQLELSIAGAVDPYFRAEAYMIVTEDEGFELEEAFAVTTGLPHGIEVEAGLMYTEFGRYNPSHPHAWTHNDQPLVIGTMFGSEGTRDLGVRVGALLPTEWFSEVHLTLQNGDNETAVSFLGEGHEHGHDEEEEEEEGSRNIEELDDLLWAARWVNGFSLGEDAEIQVGVSLAHGPNEHEDHTALYGADVVFKWFNPSASGSAGTLSWTTEFIAREAGADEAEEEASDWGLVSVVAYDITSQWRAGLRLDYVELEEHDEEEEEEGEHVPSERFRISPMISYRPSEFTNFRLQYNYTEPNEGDAVHALWLGLEVLIGSHPAHDF